MSIQILMPAASPTMEEGTLVNWLIKEGDKISPGDIIVEIETDKSLLEVEALDEGIVGRILVPDGTEEVKVNTVIALLLEDGEDISQLDSTDSVENESSDSETTDTATIEAPNTASSSSKASPHSGRIKSSPAARHVAADAGLDLATITGTGPNGRILKKDALSAVEKQQSTKTIEPATPGDIPFEKQNLSGMRKVIAQRLQQSKQTIPHFYLSVDIDIDELIELQVKLNRRLKNCKLTVNDFIIRAAALALEEVPDANVQYSDRSIIRFQRVDISIAVAVKGGLVTPVIRNAAGKRLPEISNEMQSLAEKARAGRLSPEEYQGGSFTISNLGMYGIRQFDAVINPPQAGILAIGRGEQRPIVIDGKLSIATVMTVTLSADHRIIDGTIGADLLTTMKNYLEEPNLLVI